MPYKLKGKCVHKLNKDGSLGAVVKCHPTTQEARDHMKALYANVSDATKKEVGLKEITDAPDLRNSDAQHCSNCNAWEWLPSGGEDVMPFGICRAHDFMSHYWWVCDTWTPIVYEPLMAESKELVVFKQATGKYRWLAITANAFEDAHKQVLKTEALESDVERSQATGYYGPLRWWHVGSWNIETKQAEEGLDLGTCDFAVMIGRFLVESGEFHTEEVALAVKEAAPNLRLSIGFMHPPDQPDKSGVFNTVYRFERSLLPKGKEANPYTELVVLKEGSTMASITEKITALVNLIGDEKAVRNLVSKLGLTQKELEAAGVRFKEAEATPPAATPDPVAPPAAQPETPPAGEQTPPADPPAEKPADKKAMFVNDMTPEEFNAAVKEAITEPMTLALKEALTAVVGPMISALETMGKNQTMLQQTTTKEAGDLITAQIKPLADSIGQIAADVATLKGEQPRGAQFRASREPSTLINKPLGSPSPDEHPAVATFRELVGGLAQNPQSSGGQTK